MQFNKEPKVAEETFIKLKDGESITGVFVGEPEEFYAKWVDKKSTICDPDDEGAKFRFRINFVTFKNDIFKTLIWEQGPTIYNQLKSINQEMDLSTKVIKITRHGSGFNDTSYMILPIKDVSEEWMEKIKTLELNDLKKENDVKNYAPKLDTTEEIPF